MVKKKLSANSLKLTSKSKIKANHSNQDFHKKSIRVLIKMIQQTFRIFLDHKKFWSILFGWYLIFNLLFVRGLASAVNISSANQEFKKVFAGQSNQTLKTTFSSLNLLLNQSSSGSSQVFNFFLVVFLISIILWSLKNFANQKQISVRQATYQGIDRLIPIFIVIFFIFLDFIPAIVTVYIYSQISHYHIDQTIIEKILWFIVFLGGIFITIYLLVAHLISLVVIINQPDLMPRQAIRQANKIVKNRRFIVVLDLLIFLILILIVALLIMLGAIVGLSVIAPWVYYLLTILILPIVIVFIDVLYRNLINESPTS